MRRLLAAAVAGLLLGLGLLNGRGLLADDPVQTVTVGVNLNLTAPLGETFENALRLHLETVNREELAGPGRRLRLDIRDSGGSRQAAAYNLDQLSRDRNVSAIITAGCPDCVEDAAATLTKPLISLDAAAVAEDQQWVFRMGPVAADVADLLSRTIAGDGATTLAVVAGDDRYSDEGVQWLADAAGRDDMDLVATHRVDPSDAAARAAAAADVAQWTPGGFGFGVEQTGPDAVVLWLPAPHAEQAAAGLRDAGYTGPFYLDMLAADGLTFTSSAAQVWPGATLVFTSTPVSLDNVDTSFTAVARSRWVGDYLGRYGRYDIHSSWAADALTLLADAVARADDPAPAQVLPKLARSRVDALTGLLRFTGSTHSGLDPISVVTLTGLTDRWY